MHELKTPIAKGKLIAELTENEKNKQRLGDIFARFEFLLSEFAKIERVTSSEFTLNTQEFRIVDAIDNALDLLMLDQASVTLDIQADTKQKIDFELFSIAIKNLIDNAIKYSDTHPIIQVEENTLNIISQGEQLDESLFSTIFNREFEDSSSGLGLGLYITKSIVQKHGFTLEYQYRENNNIISIIF
jgi:two-component system OmpR family sensor kinase